MILNNTINARTFVYCAAYWSPHETTEYFSGTTGFYHQFAYVVHGQGLVEHRLEQNGPVIHSSADNISGTLLDLSNFKNTYQTVTTTDQPLSLIHFNPIPDTRNLKVDILKEGRHQIVVTTHDATVVCITGKIMVNGVELQSMQHARVRRDSLLDIKLGPLCVCAVVTSE